MTLQKSLKRIPWAKNSLFSNYLLLQCCGIHDFVISILCPPKRTAYEKNIMEMQVFMNKEKAFFFFFLMLWVNFWAQVQVNVCECWTVMVHIEGKRFRKENLSPFYFKKMRDLSFKNSYIICFSKKHREY